jgi:diadenosine tetraphosphate (Ap4A) HIT family hydrolase
MREIETIDGTTVRTGCIGCAVVSGSMPAGGNIYRSERFDAHQDIEIALPGFVIVSTVRHLVSIRELTGEEQIEFAQIVSRIREAQFQCGLENVYLFQNEDTTDHFHLWMFPVYEWMTGLGKGAALLAAAMHELKSGRHQHPPEEVFATAALLKSHLGILHG